MDVDNKPTILDDEADIYQRREEKSTKQKFNELQGKEKQTYFKDYYLKKIIVLILALCLLAYFIYTVQQSKKRVNLLYVAVADLYFPESISKQLEDEFGEYIGKTSEYEDITFDTSYYIQSGGDYASYEKLEVLIMVGDMDVFIAPESTFEPYMTSGVMTSLTESLPTDLYSNLDDRFYYGIVNDSDTDESVIGKTEVYGIYIDDIPLFNYVQEFEDRPVLGLVVTSKNRESAVEFIRFLFNEFEPDYEYEAVN